MGILPHGFAFSQASLQDFVDCPRRFQLKYVLKLAWPAIAVEPLLGYEEDTERGQVFHRLVERFYNGVPPEVISGSISDSLLLGWWQTFLEEPPLSLPEKVLLPEVRMNTVLDEQRLVAIFDLLAIDPERRLVIVDWKTGRFRPKRESVDTRWQTKLYPFVAVEAGERFFKTAVNPDRVSMVFWYANYPEEPHVFHYSQDQHRSIREQLRAVFSEISQCFETEQWKLAGDEGHCKFCVYRSLCDRGIAAGVEDGISLEVGDLMGFIDVDIDLDDYVY